jgi:tetratricopeptide (TPR) repeat protein
MFGQDGIPKEKRKAIVNSNNLTVDANEKLQSNQFIDAEADYRRAISKNGENAVAKYNLGNAYYNKDSYSEAFSRYKQAGEIAQTKAQKHKAFHNIGNVFMKNKEYEKAVEAYKNALRNNPTDDETRYNLALAKELLKKQQQEQQNDQEKDDQEKEDDQNNKGEGDNEKKDDEGEEKKEEENDKGDEGDNKENEKEGDDGDQKKENPQDKQQNKPNDQQKGKPRQSQLSPQQIKALLQAMNNEEKKVQEKMNAAKVKGAKTKNEKDW